jgi:syntaxin of plants SYP7
VTCCIHTYHRPLTLLQPVLLTFDLLIVGGTGECGGRGAVLTDGQQAQIMTIQERDAEFVVELNEIEEGVRDLKDIAKRQGEEVDMQNAMLDRTNNKMDDVTQRVTGVNGRLKETLGKVGRGGDKIMMDIMCIVLAIGFVAVIYNFLTRN